MWWDADIDAVMTRTARRPIPAGRVTPRRGARLRPHPVDGLGARARARAQLVRRRLLAFTIFFYAVIYSMWLKRSTPQNIVIGGAAGRSSPMVADAAVTGGLGIESLVLFAIIFLWTPPHFWALALVKSGDYARAGVPMLPNVAGPDATRRQIWLYTLVLVPVGVLPVALGFGGAAYAVVSLLSGLGMAAFAWRVYRVRTGDEAMKCAQQLFAFSILYLFLLFAVLLAESALGLRFGLPGLV
jgi:protoheme IX farnesyltransferase